MCHLVLSVLVPERYNDWVWDGMISQELTQMGSRSNHCISQEVICVRSMDLD